MKRLLALAALLLLAGCPSRTRTVFLVRHGESFVNVGGSKDALTAKGRDQIAAVAKELASEKIEAIFASPLGRTRETAAIIGSATGVTPVVAEELRPLAKGESAERAVRFVKEKAAKGPARFVIVSHGDVIPALLDRAEPRKKHEPPTGSLSEIRIDGEKWVFVK